MPRYSNVLLLLTEQAQRELNIKLASGNFASYQALSDWLKSQGFEISKSSVHRYGQNFQSKLEDIKQTIEKAKAIVESVGDDENDLAEGLTRLAQHRMAELLLKIGDSVIGDDGEDRDFNISPADLAKVGSTIASLNRSSIDIKKYRKDVRVAVAEVIDRTKESIASDASLLTPDILEKIRRDIYGIIDR